MCCLKKQFNPNVLRKLNQLCDTKCGCFRMNLLLFKEKNVASFVHLLSKKKHSEWIEYIKLPLENDKVIYFPLINLDSSKSTYKSTYVWNRIKPSEKQFWNVLVKNSIFLEKIAFVWSWILQLANQAHNSHVQREKTKQYFVS